MANADRIIELLHEAKARPAGAEREQFLAESCRDDAALKEQILSLLEADVKEGDADFLKINQILRPTILPTEKPGDRIGRYKLLEQIGEGGCGVVYMAEQEEPVRRRVALKVIKLGMDTKQVIARFEAERQALAMMDHPNIAKVLDAGATETGRPFFVMELVRGIKITDYCDQNHLSTNERLELFIQVCQAIQHAHQKGIIHRDIKPSNILVTRHDDVAVPKVIDFGIAKATVGQLTDKTVFTAFAQFIGTPAYMSPEQAQMSGLDIDTRADIYSLGVLLYELLTGNTPFDAKKLLAAGLDEMRRKIREEEPAKPSTCLSTMQAMDLTTVAKRRHVEPPKLIHLVRGDLDWLVMKCLEKDRTRRYETANGLAADIRRHLNSEPVTACPPSRWYEFQKTVRRHKFGFATATALIVVLGLGLGISTWMFIKERQARQRAVAAEQEQVRLRQQAEIEIVESRRVATFLGSLAETLRHNPNVTTWDTAYREALAMWMRVLGKEHPEVQDALSSLAPVLQRGKFPKADPAALEAAQKCHAAMGYFEKLASDPKRQQDCWVFANALQDIGWIFGEIGQMPEAEQVYRDTQMLWRKMVAVSNLEDHRFHLACNCDTLGSLLQKAGRRTEALEARRAALAIWLKLVAEFNHEDRRLHLAFTDSEIGHLLQEAGRFTEAIEIYQQAVDVWKKLVVDFDKDYYRNQRFESMMKLAGVLQTAGKATEARLVFQEVESALYEDLASRRKTPGSASPELGSTLHQLAVFLRDQGKPVEAETAAREAFVMRQKLLGKEHSDVAASSKLLWELVVAQGKTVELEALLAQLPGAEASSPEAARLQFAQSLWQMGNDYLQHERFKDAERAFEQALQKFKHLQQDFPTNAYYRQEQAFSLRLLANVRQRTGRLAEAEAGLQTAHDIYSLLAKEIPTEPFYPREAGFTRGRIADVLVAQGKVVEAEAMCRDDLVAKRKLFGEADPETADALRRLARVLARQGKFAEAKILYLEAAEHADAYTLNEIAFTLASAPSPKLRDGPVALALAEKAVAGTNRNNPMIVDTLAAAHAELGQFTDAVRVQREAIALLRDEKQKNDYLSRLKLYESGLPYREHWQLADMASALLDEMKPVEAEPLARECLALRERLIPDDWRTFNARSMLGGSFLGQRKYAEAEPLLVSAYEGMKQREDKIPANGKVRLKENLQRLVQLYEASGQTEKAAEWQKKLGEFEKAEAGKKLVAPKP